MLPRSRRLAPMLALAGAVGALFCTSAAHAQLQVVVAPTVTSTGALYTYSYSITNFTATELAVVNLSGLPQTEGALTNLMAPAGFQTTFDPGVGIASFLPDNSASPGMFGAGSTIAGFSFDSLFAPSTVPFDTLDVSGGSSAGTTPGPAAVPEASTSFTLGAGLAALTFFAVRRRRATLSSVHS